MRASFARSAPPLDEDRVMAWWTTLLVVVQIVCALSIIILVLLQHGKGADMEPRSAWRFGQSVRRNGIGQLPLAQYGRAGDGVFLATIGLAYSGTSHRVPKNEGAAAS